MKYDEPDNQWKAFITWNFARQSSPGPAGIWTHSTNPRAFERIVMNQWPVFLIVYYVYGRQYFERDELILAMPCPPPGFKQQHLIFVASFQEEPAAKKNKLFRLGISDAFFSEL